MQTIQTNYLNEIFDGDNLAIMGLVGIAIVSLFTLNGEGAKEIVIGISGGLIGYIKGKASK